MKLDKAALDRAMTLYAVTDRAWLGESTLVQAVEKALRGGATFVQLREKELDHETFLKEAREIRGLCAAWKVPFVINDAVDIALACDADGVHVGQSDMAAARARELLGPDKIIGVSAHTVEEALEAKRQGADYLGVGTMFPTTTKLDAEAVSFDTLRDICRQSQLPVVAIGGINAGNVHKLRGTGAGGVAVVSAIFAAPDIEEAARRLRALAEEIRGDMIRGVLFDMDGTLLDSMYVWDDCAAMYLRRRGVTPPDDLNAQLATLSFSEGIAWLHDRYFPGEPLEEIDHGVYLVIRDEYLYKAVLKPGAAEALAGLHALGIPMAVTTSNDLDLTQAAFERCGVLQYFQGIYTCRMAGAGKTRPDVYDMALRAMGLEDRSSAAVVEDALYALRTAKAAGYRAVGVPDPAGREEWAQLQQEADVFISDLTEWRKILHD